MNRLLASQYKIVLYATLKKYSTKCIYNEEFSVSPFCNLFVTCPFNVKIKPIDVHKYPHCDKLFVKVVSDSEKTNATLTCFEDRDKINFFGEITGRGNYSCLVEAPVKANVNVVATAKGDIDVKKLNGERIILESEEGNIISEKCQVSQIAFTSRKGNIITLGTLHAAEIELIAKENGNIEVNHLQALKATVLTENGNIRIKSSYCDDTTIETNRGKLVLDNLHKKCSIKILKNGSLLMTGFDGTLNADIMEGDMDIQVSKLYDTSKIVANKKSSILLRLSEWIQDNTMIKSSCQQLKVSDEIILLMKNKDNLAILTPKHSNHTSELEINTNLSNVNIEGASWSDMLKLKGIKFSD